MAQKYIYYIKGTLIRYVEAFGGSGVTVGVDRASCRTVEDDDEAW